MQRIAFLFFVLKIYIRFIKSMNASDIKIVGIADNLDVTYNNITLMFDKDNRINADKFWNKYVGVDFYNWYKKNWQNKVIANCKSIGSGVNVTHNLKKEIDMYYIGDGCKGYPGFYISAEDFIMAISTEDKFNACRDDVEQMVEIYLQKNSEQPKVIVGKIKELTNVITQLNSKIDMMQHEINLYKENVNLYGAYDDYHEYLVGDMNKSNHYKYNDLDWYSKQFSNNALIHKLCMDIYKYSNSIFSDIRVCINTLKIRHCIRTYTYF